MCTQLRMHFTSCKHVHSPLICMYIDMYISVRYSLGHVTVYIDMYISVRYSLGHVTRVYRHVY